MNANETKRPGAPRGNANRMTHGLRGSKLPKGAKAEENAGYAFRRLLMEALEAQHGKGRVSVAAQALVQTAHRREMEARLAARWLRQGDDLTLAEKLNLSAIISRASEARDEIIRQLGLTVSCKPTTDEIGRFYSQPPAYQTPESFSNGSGRTNPTETPALPPAGPQAQAEKQQPTIPPPGDSPNAISQDHPPRQTPAPEFPQSERDTGGARQGPQPEAEAERGAA